MRKLMWITIGFSAAFFLCISYFWGCSLWLVFAGIGAVSAVLGLCAVRREVLRIPALLLLGCTVGIGWLSVYQTVYLKPLADLDGQTVHLTVEVSSFPTQSRYSKMVDGWTVLNGRRCRMRIYLDEEDCSCVPGDVLESDFRLRRTTPGGQKESVFYQGQGIFFVASQKGTLQVREAEKRNLLHSAAIWGNAIQEEIDALFPEDTVPFVKALLLGDTEELDYAVDSSLKISGIRHVAAVSGLHVAILYSLVTAVLGRRRFLTPFVSAFVLFVFAGAVGFTPSVTRACIMTGIMGFGLLSKQEYDSPTALSAACLLMLLYNPFLVLSVSFQLSVGSVAGILMFAGKFNKWIRSMAPTTAGKGILSGVVSWIASSLSVTLSAMVFTVPISAWCFGSVSLISGLTNLLTLWIISGIFIGIAVICAVGLFSEAIAAFAASILSYPIRYVLWVARILAKFPLAAVYTESKWIVCWLVGCYALLLLFFLFQKKKPLLFLLVGLAGLAVAVGISWIQPRLDDCRITVVSVGEGQCILLQSRGERFLVDCGGNSDTTAADAAAAALLSQGVFRLDGIALTHYDRDHTGALLNLLTRVEASEAYFPLSPDKGYLETFASEQTIPISYISETETFPFGSGRLTLFSPGSLKTDNENCMCILFETENCAILITGDRGKSGETHLVREEQIPDVDILIAGHHGSKYATNDVLLEAAKPETVIISCSAGNSYGHPAPELLERLERHGCTVLRTDLQGTITIRR